MLIGTSGTLMSASFHAFTWKEHPADSGFRGENYCLSLRIDSRTLSNTSTVGEAVGNPARSAIRARLSATAHAHLYLGCVERTFVRGSKKLQKKLRQSQ